MTGPQEFPSGECLVAVDADLEHVNPIMGSEKGLEGLNQFLAASGTISGEVSERSSAILKNYHHRSAELPNQKGELREDSYGGFHGARRLKGMGLYSGPKPEWLHKIRNLKKDPTGYVLGLQPEHVFGKALINSQILREMGVETEVPEGAFRLNEVIWETRERVCVRMDIKDAFIEAELPEEYKDIPFVIRVDAMGINHRLLDFVQADTLIEGEEFTGSVVREIMIREASEFLVKEHQKLGLALPDGLEESPLIFVEFILKRVMRNAALLHKNKGIHGQFTMQNLTLDGKFIDYDTLSWIGGDVFEEARLKDLTKLKDSVTNFLKEFLVHALVPGQSREAIEGAILVNVFNEYNKYE